MTEFNDKDPLRESYAKFHPRRLTAEELRDALLAVSGELNMQVGGIPCRPNINFEVAMQPRQIMGGTASVYEPNATPQQRNRRTVYAEKIRGIRDPFMETFNQPGPDKSCEIRETSTIAPQALTLINAQQMQERAFGFATRLKELKVSDSATIDAAFKLALGRLPTPSERDACLEHWKASVKREEGKSYRKITLPTETKRTVMAEKTGEPYEFTEYMPVYENYVSDIGPADVDAETRGLAHVCLVILNLNEFSYLD